MVLFIILAYILIALITYGKLPFTFFQQDEWLIFGIFIYWIKAGLDWIQRLSSFGSTHVVLLNNLLFYLQFKVFGINFFPYAISNIALHIANAFLVYYLANIYTRKKIISFTAGLLFLINPTTDQTIIWVASTLGTAGATFFSLLSIIFFMLFLLKGEKIVHLGLSALLLIVSLNFKETSLFLLLFFPILWITFAQKKNYRKAFKAVVPFVLFGFLYFLFRVYLILNGHVMASSDPSLLQPPIPVYFYRLVTLPIKFIVESIIPVPNIIDAARSIILVAYPRFVNDGAANPYIVESVASDIVILISFFTILLFSMLTISYFRNLKQLKFIKTLSISLLFMGLSSLPLVVVPGVAGYLSLIDGRHLYLTSVFASLFISVLFSVGFNLIKEFKFFKISLLILISLYVFSNAIKIRNDIHQQVATAFIRKNILSQVQSTYPLLPKKVIFYMEGDRAYYGLSDEEKIFPFQSGLGQTLLVWYNKHTEDFPSCFFENPKFLYALTSEGYKECGGRGFGYFRKKESLILAMRKEEFSKDNIIAFRYNSDKQSLTDITKSTKKELQK